MKRKKGVKIIFILILFVLMFSVVSARFSFFSLKNSHEEINVTINFQTSSVIRTGSDFQAFVVIKNFNEDKPVIIDEIKILDENQNTIEIIKVDQRLKSIKNEVKQRERLLKFLQKPDSCDKMESIVQRVALIIFKKIDSEIEKETFQKTFALDINDFKENLGAGDIVPIEIDIKYKVGFKKYSSKKQSKVLFSEALPVPPHNSPGWYVGDQHMHSRFGRTFTEIPDPLKEMTDESRIKGLNWVIFTDHSPAFSDASEWITARNACFATSTSNFKCLYGQEMSIGAVENRCDTLGNSHYLTHPSIDDNFEYINGYCGALQCDDCRDEQTVIDEVNSAGGIGFIAHPYERTFNWKDWSLTGFSGIEIINSKTGDFEEEDKMTINNPGGIKDSWTEFLDYETDSQNGFIVGVGGSDAHHIEEVGNTFTYCYINSETLTTQAIRNAYKKGNCVASTGPFLAFTLNDKIIGETAEIIPGKYFLDIQAASTNEFGNLKNLEIYVGSNLEKNIPLSGLYYYDKVLIDLDADDKYIRMVVHTEKDKLSITNPIWLDVDNSISLFDFKNSLGEIVASFRSNGNLNLKGDCFYSTECIGEEDSMIWQNSNYETVAYIGILGNLCLEKNTCDNYNQANCNPTTDAFLVQDNSKTNLSYIDFNGNLCLTGKLNENT